MKKCFKCNEVKALTSFYKHKEMLDGHFNKCKECNKKDVKKNRLLKLEYYRSYDRARGSRITAEKQTQWRKDNPAKYQAQTLIQNLLRAKKLLKQPCEICKDKKSHAHHDDYLYPFSIKWLCASHHSEWHKKNGEGKNGKLNLKNYNLTSINDFNSKL